MTIIIDKVRYDVTVLCDDIAVPLNGGRHVTHRYDGGRYGGRFYRTRIGTFGTAGIWHDDIRDAANMAQQGAGIQYHIDKARVDEYEAQMKEVLNANS